MKQARKDLEDKRVIDPVNFDWYDIIHVEDEDDQEIEPSCSEKEDNRGFKLQPVEQKDDVKYSSDLSDSEKGNDQSNSRKLETNI